MAKLGMRAPQSARQRTTVAPHRPGQAPAPGVSTEGLERYFEDLKGHRVLSAAEELSLAREIEAREVALWSALLANVAALPLIERALTTAEAAVPPALVRARRKKQPLGDKAREALAWTLRDVDEARAALGDVCDEVATTLDKARGTKGYLGRVAAARAAHQAKKHELAACNLRLVVSMARRYGQSLLPLTDLVQEGNLGLLRAVDGFDYRRGFRFSTYASWWIRHALNRGLSDRGRLVRVPVHAMEGAQRVAKLQKAFFSRTGREATVEELAKELGVAEKKLVLLREPGLAMPPVSLDRKLGDDSSATLLDMLPDDDQEDAESHLEQTTTQRDVEQLMRALPAIEADILRSRFGLEDGREETLREIGQRYNLSRERIRQLEQKALLTLRHGLENREHPFGEDVEA